MLQKQAKGNRKQWQKIFINTAILQQSDKYDRKCYWHLIHGNIIN